MDEKQLVEKLRQKYMQNPPEGMTSEMVKRMSDNDLLDMDYFLNEEFDDDDVGEEGFYIFLRKENFPIKKVKGRVNPSLDSKMKKTHFLEQI